MALNRTRIQYDITFNEYAAAFMVFKRDIKKGVLDSILGVETILANSQQEAENAINRKILEKFSVTDGYTGHKVTAMSIFKKDGTE